MTKVDASGKVEPYTWKAIACTAALSLAAIATELQGIRRVLEQREAARSVLGRRGFDQGERQVSGPLERSEPADYPSLPRLLDDVLVLSTWVQRQSLRWTQGTPAREALELMWMERYLGELVDGASRARARVETLRRAAERREEDERPDFVGDALDERWKEC